MARQLAGTSNGHTRRFNRRVVLEAIRLFGPISRAEVARRTALMFPTVSNIVTEFLEQDIVRMVGRATGARGQPATLIALNGDAAFTYGLHLDRGQIRTLLVDLAGKVRARATQWVETPDAAETVAMVEDMVLSMHADAAVSPNRVIGAGLTLPGPVDPETQTSAALPNPGWRGAPLRDELQKRFGVPVSVERDAPAAALGERLHGDGRSVRNFFYVNFTYGVGGGLILGGQPYRGVNGYAGEIGHYPSVRNGRPCLCGARGCLENYVSPAALFSDLDIAGPPAEAARRLAQMSADRDPRLLEWAGAAAAFLAPALMAIENVLDVEAIFFGGYLPEALAAELIERLVPILQSMRMSGKSRHPELRIATSGADAAALGAAVLPVFDVLTPDPTLWLNDRKSAAGRPQAAAVLQL